MLDFGVAEADDGEDTVVGVDTDKNILFLDAREVQVLEKIAYKTCAVHALGPEAVAGVPGTEYGNTPLTPLKGGW